MPAGRSGGLIDYVNLPPMIGVVISSRLASLQELQTVYGVGDLFNIAEILSVDAYNRRELNKPG